MSTSPYDDRLTPVESLPTYFSLLSNSGGWQDIMSVIASYFTGIPGATRPGQLGFQADTAASSGVGNLLNLPSMLGALTDARKQDAIGTARKWIGTLQRLGLQLDDSDQRTILAVAEKVQFLPLARIRSLLKDQVGLPDVAINAICDQLGPDGGRRFDALMQLSPGTQYQFQSKDFEVASEFLRTSFDEYGRNEQGMKMSDVAEGIGSAMRSGRLRTYASTIQPGSELRAATKADISSDGSPSLAMQLAANRRVRDEQGEQTGRLLQAPDTNILRPHFGEEGQALYNQMNSDSSAANIPNRDIASSYVYDKQIKDLFDTTSKPTAATEEEKATLSTLQETYRKEEAAVKASYDKVMHTGVDSSGNAIGYGISYDPSALETVLQQQAESQKLTVDELIAQNKVSYTGSIWGDEFKLSKPEEREEMVAQHRESRKAMLASYQGVHPDVAKDSTDTSYAAAYKWHSDKRVANIDARDKAVKEAQNIRIAAAKKSRVALQKERDAALKRYYEDSLGYTPEDSAVAVKMLSMNEALMANPTTANARWLYSDSIDEPMRALYTSARADSPTLPALTDNMTVADMMSNLETHASSTKSYELAKQLQTRSAEVSKLGGTGRFTIENRDALYNTGIDTIQAYQEAVAAGDEVKIRELEKSPVIEEYRVALGTTDAHQAMEETAKAHAAILKTGRLLPNWSKLSESAGGDGMLAESLFRKFTAGSRSFDVQSTTKSIARIGESARRMNVDAQMLEPVAGATATIASQQGMSASANPALMDASLMYASSYLRNSIIGNQLDTATAVNMGVTAVDRATQTQAYKNTVALGSAEGEITDTVGKEIQRKLKNGETLTAEEQQWLSKTDNVREALRSAGYNDQTMMGLFDKSRLDVLRVENPELANTIMRESIASGDQALWQWHENQITSGLDQYSDKIDKEQASAASKLYLDVLSLTGDYATALAVAGSKDIDVAKILRSKGVSQEKINEIQKQRAFYLTDANAKDVSSGLSLTTADSRALEGSIRQSTSERALEQAISEGNAIITNLPFGTTAFTERNQDPNASVADIITSLIQSGVTTVDGSDISKKQMERTLLFKTLELTQSSSEARNILQIPEQNIEAWEKQLLNAAKEAGIDTTGKTVDDILADEESKAKLLTHIGKSIADEKVSLGESGEDVVPLAGNRVVQEFEQRKQEQAKATARRENALGTASADSTSVPATETTAPETSTAPLSLPPLERSIYPEEQRTTNDQVTPQDTSLELRPNAYIRPASEILKVKPLTPPEWSSESTSMSSVESQVTSVTPKTDTSSISITSEDIQKMVMLLSDLKTYLEAGNLKVQSTLLEA